MLKLLTCIFLFYLLSSCNKNELSVISIVQPPNLEGYWSLINYKNSPFGTEVDYNTGENVWLFNTDSLKVTIDNVNNFPTFLANGTYSFQFSTTFCEEEVSLIINDINMGDFKLNEVLGNRIILHQDCINGHRIELKK